MRAEILVGETVGRERLRDQSGEQGESMPARSVGCGELGGFGRGSAGTVCGKLSSGQAVRSAAVNGEGDGVEQVLEGPAAGEVEKSGDPLVIQLKFERQCSC
jgi:hypothetical protein